MKHLFLAAALALTSSAAFAGGWPLVVLGTDDVDAGVLCKVKDVTVLAASAEDCGKIGGEATHTVTTTHTPVK